MKILVAATNYSKYCGKGKKMLEEAGFELIENTFQRPYTSAELKKIIPDVDGVIAGTETWNKDCLSRADRLKVIARFGAGVDNIDLEAARERNIIVCNCPGINRNAVAEHTVALLLSACRRIPMLNQQIECGIWQRPMFRELRSLNIGLIGFGAIAKSVVEKLQGFHPKIYAYDKYPDLAFAKEKKVEIVSLEKLLMESDIISLHIPYTKETDGFINREKISCMKNGVILVNTARGGVIDENSVKEALGTKKIGVYAADVFAEEPPGPENILIKEENFIGTPHVAAETYENCEETSVVTAQILLDTFQGKKPENRLV